MEYGLFTISCVVVYYERRRKELRNLKVCCRQEGISKDTKR